MNITPTRRALGTALTLLALCLSSACAKRPEHKMDVSEPRTFRWTAEARDAAGELPVQHQARVKPLSTVASFALLKIQGKRKYTLPAASELPTAGEKLDPTAWLLDVLFFPEQAAEYEVFLVEDSAVLAGVGLSFPDRKKRDRYSYNQLEPARGRILAGARAASSKEQRYRSPIDRQTMDLYQRLNEFESLAGTLDFARIPVPAAMPEALRSALGPSLHGNRMSALAFRTRFEPMQAAFKALRDGDAEGQNQLRQFETALAGGLERLVQGAPGTLALLAPEVPPGETVAPGSVIEWETPGEVIAGLLDEDNPRTDQLALMTALEGAYQNRGDGAALTAQLVLARDAGTALAQARGAGGKIALERAYYRLNFFYNALAVFLLAFVFAAFSWVAPGVRWVPRAVTWTTAVGCALVIAGVTMRCVLRGRPPVVSLYDTILFITGTGVLTSLVLGKVMRLPLAATVGALMGAVGMFMANRYEVREAASSGDTMAAVQAVLDTNFWLATHVTSVTLGYSAGLFACLLAHVWLGARFIGFRPGDTRWYRQLGRAVYGIVAFGLLFSVVGTILGGIWANDSWGRFWGWDPKENGALMICLFELALVHARLGGYIKDFGVAVGAVILGPIVAFSWWHVNLLGVGLHSYGFTDGITEKLFAYYTFEIGVVLAALVWWTLAGRTILGGGPARLAAAGGGAGGGGADGTMPE